MNSNIVKTLESMCNHINKLQHENLCIWISTEDKVEKWPSKWTADIQWTIILNPEFLWGHEVPLTHKLSHLQKAKKNHNSNLNNVFILEQWYINLWCPPIMCHLAYSLIIKPCMTQRAVIFSSDTAATFPSTTRAQEFCFDHLGWTWLARAVTESFYSSGAIMIRSNGSLSNRSTFPTLDILLACLQASRLVDIYTTSLT